MIYHQNDRRGRVRMDSNCAKMGGDGTEIVSPCMQIAILLHAPAA